MDTLTLITVLLVGSYFAISWFVAAGCILGRFWTRGRLGIDIFCKLQQKKWPFLEDSCDSEADHFVMLIAYDGFLGFSITTLVGFFVEAAGLAGLLTVIGIVSTILVPRYIMDLVHCLQYSFKVRDSKRLADLEAEIERIKSGE